MTHDRIIPTDPLDFIRGCVHQRQILWTYHVNMRMKARAISREMILASESSYEIIESYPDDKYLPSYLVLARSQSSAFHVVFAVDVVGDNIRVVTAYAPDPSQWTSDLKSRRRL